LVTLHDTEGHRLYVSPSYHRVTGWTEDDLQRTDWRTRVHPDDLPLVEQTRQANLGGDATTLEHRVRCRDGRWLWTESRCRPIVGPDGRVRQLLVWGRDITKRKRAEAEARLAQLAREELITSVDGIVWEVDASTFRFTFVSAQAERLLGYPVREWIANPTFWPDHIHPDDREQAVSYCLAQTKAKRDHAFDYRMVTADGKVVWLHEAVTVVVENDQPAKLRGLMVDITERKLLEAQLRESQKMEAIGQLAGGIAHDFNNILAAILGNAELMHMGPPLSPANTECLAAITGASHRAADLVRQILAFSRHQEHVRLPIRLDTVAREAVKLLRATLPATIELRSSFATPRTALADASQIHQVIINLCTNAMHAMADRAGVLTVELTELELDAEAARACIGLRPGLHLRLSVSDTGCGMSHATKGRIFEPFFTTKPPGTGTGLGLSVVHGIMRGHEGAITVQSEPGHGTTFQLYFPVAEASAGTPATGASAVPRGQGERILFVDDEQSLTQLSNAFLSRLGYQVTALSSPVDALARFRADPTQFDLVITDLNMPVMNGTTLAREMLLLRPGLKIILSTGFSATLTPEGVRALGFQALLPKPTEFRMLGEFVRAALIGQTQPAV
jgi:PAS domain S-box-containing protein